MANRWSRGYTLCGAPQSVNGPGLASTYGVDVLGNITTLTSGATQQYRYDAIQRLTRVETANLQRIDAWTYDGTGNATARGSDSLFYGDHNRLVNWSSAFLADDLRD